MVRLGSMCVRSAYRTVPPGPRSGVLDGRLSALANDWQRFHVVPVDDRCLHRASEIGCGLQVRTLDAIHLAAAERLPGPTPFLTFDRRESVAAVTLGLQVIPN